MTGLLIGGPTLLQPIRCVLTVLSVTLSFTSPATSADSIPPRVSPPAFSAGERFTYTLSWLGISAGTAVMAVDRPPGEEGRKTFKLVTTATSNSFVSVFYPVDNRVESVVDAETMAPQRLVFRRREGRRKNDFDVTFRHEEGTVIAIKDGVTRTIPIPEGTQDAISCLYYVRNLPHLTPGTSHVLTVHHDNKNYRLEVQIEGIERLHGPWGDVETVRVLAIMPFRGIFLNEGNIRVWLTNDAHHVPVMMKAKVIVGSVRARLVAGWRETPAP